MPDSAVESEIIAATPEHCFAVATDVEQYPQWAHDVKEVTIRERDAQSRPVLVDYRVAAPHFAPDGVTENLGTYGLSMRSDLVQCLYGVKEVPVKVEISITSGSSGESRGSTVSLFRNGNWVYLSAEGFTFSSPTLKVKLVQPEAVKTEAVKTEVAKTEVAAAPKKVVAIKVISCAKGKITKKVSGTNPKCPAGYKKK